MIAAVLAGRCSSCVVPVVEAPDVGDSPDVNELRVGARHLRPVIGSGCGKDPLFTGNASLPFSRPASRRREREGRRPAASALCPLPAARCNLPVRPRRCCSLIIPRSQQTFALHPFACSFLHLFISGRCTQCSGHHPSPSCPLVVPRPPLAVLPRPVRTPTQRSASPVCSQNAPATNQAERQIRAPRAPPIDHFLQTLHLDRNVCAP